MASLLTHAVDSKNPSPATYHSAFTPVKTGVRNPAGKIYPKLWDVMGRSVAPISEAKDAFKGVIVRIAYPDPRTAANDAKLSIGKKIFHIRLPKADPELDSRHLLSINLINRICRFNPIALGWVRDHLQILADNQNPQISLSSLHNVIELVEQHKKSWPEYDALTPTPPRKRCKIETKNVVMYYQDPSTRTKGEKTADVIYVLGAPGQMLYTDNTTHEYLLTVMESISKQVKNDSGNLFFSNYDPHMFKDLTNSQLAAREPGWRENDKTSDSYSTDATSTDEFDFHSPTDSVVPPAFGPARIDVEEAAMIDKSQAPEASVKEDTLNRVWRVQCRCMKLITPTGTSVGDEQVAIEYFDTDLREEQGSLTIGQHKYRIILPVSPHRRVLAVIQRMAWLKPGQLDCFQKYVNIFSRYEKQGLSLDKVEKFMGEAEMVKKSTDMHRKMASPYRPERIYAISSGQVRIQIAKDTTYPNKMNQMHVTYGKEMFLHTITNPDLDIEFVSCLAILLSALTSQEIKDLIPHFKGETAALIPEIARITKETRNPLPHEKLSAELKNQNEKLTNFLSSHRDGLDERLKPEFDRIESNYHRMINEIGSFLHQVSDGIGIS